MPLEASTKCPTCNAQCPSCGLISSKRSPVMKTISLGDDLGDYVLRLRWTAGDYGITWIDFELIEVTAKSEGPPGQWTVPGYQRHGATYSPDTTPDIEKAELAAEGFLKWDGCMQFNVAYVHVDTDLELTRLLAAIKSARELAAAEMTAYDGD